MSNLWHLHFLIYMAVQLVSAQQQAASNTRQPGVLDRAILNLLAENGNKHDGLARESQGEQVDKLASAIGDLYWRNQQPDWLYQQQQQVGPANFRIQRSLGALNGIGEFQDELPGDYAGYGPVGLDGPSSGSHNYRALVDEFKQYSRLANPSRESRAFKPKLMSTARGFGKRSQQSADELGAPSSPNGKMSGSAQGSKYADWISQVVSKWPLIHKYINEKYLDYNGDGLVTLDEKYQSL